jgi:hypothetical protein
MYVNFNKQKYQFFIIKKILKNKNEFFLFFFSFIMN